MFTAAGADIIDVSAGQTSTEAQPVYGRMFQTPFSDRIRNEAGIATMAVGNIYEADHVNSILMAGRADLVCLARPHLADPYWMLHEATRLGDRARKLAVALSERPRSGLAAGRPRGRDDARMTLAETACPGHRRRHRASARRSRAAFAGRRRRLTIDRPPRSRPLQATAAPLATPWRWPAT